MKSVRSQKTIRAALIIAAGGNGTRFADSLPKNKADDHAALSKLFCTLGGQSVLARSLKAFGQCKEIQEIIVAAPLEAKKQTLAIADGLKIKNFACVKGGATRAESVYNALRAVKSDADWIMVHDGARPLVEAAALQNLIQSAGSVDGVILARKVVPTIKEADSEGNILRTVDRSALYEAETPQLVRRDLLSRAYQNKTKAFQATDEASLIESVKGKTKVVTHTGWNPKITTFKDLELAEAYLSKGAQTRTGFGRDLHRLVKGRKLYLGGLHIPFELGSLGHSDGDVILHSIADAILGAIGAGDIGEWFSDKDPKFKNMRSEKFLEAILAECEKRSAVIENVDTVVTLERPKLAGYKSKIKTRVAQILNISENQISIKAKTNEGLGPEGEGLAVSCEALVTMKLRGQS